MELIHMTATYSNALLVAILPHVSDFAAKLDLPIKKPVTLQQVQKFSPSQYRERAEGAVWLTNGWWFMFDHQGYVQSFRSPKDAIALPDDFLEHTERFIGETRMTTNEMVALARETLVKLGWQPSVTRSDETPKIEGPSNLKTGEHIPYCRVAWRKTGTSDGYSDVHVDINTQEKTVVGLYLNFARTHHIGTPIEVNVEPELESEFRKRTKANLFIRTNAPPRLPLRPSESD
jgi:hypothetical protein